MRIGINTFLLCFLLFPFFADSQYEMSRFWSVGFNAGTFGWSPSSVQAANSNYFNRTLMNFGTAEIIDVDGKKSSVVSGNTSIGIHASYLFITNERAKQTGFFFEFQKNQAWYSLNPPYKFTYKGSDSQLWVNADNYLKYSFGIMRTLGFLGTVEGNPCYIKMSFGQTFFHRQFKERVKTGDKADWTENGTGFKTTVVSASKKSGMISIEFGRKILLKNDIDFDLGIVYHQPLINSRTVEYEFFKSDTSYGKSRITFFGSTIMLNVTWNFNYKVKTKPETLNSFDNLALDSSKSQHLAFKNKPHRINGRKFNVQQTISCSTSEISVFIWDKNKEDGDQISLYLNGKAILENHTVSKTKMEINIKLQPGSNIIVMHALNLGRVPPNTAALRIEDGTKPKIITLISDLEKSGALEIIYNP
jgi:hypothetical protein